MWLPSSPYEQALVCLERCGRRQLVLQTVSRRSEPSSRTALMGEQPNPWEVLPPQDATSRHRAISAVSGGADYLSTLHPIGARGRRLMATIDFIHAWMRIAISPLVVERISRYRVMLKLSSADFPRCCPRPSRDDPIGVHRYKPVPFDGVSTIPPQFEVPNHAVAVNAWA